MLWLKYCLVCVLSRTDYAKFGGNIGVSVAPSELIVNDEELRKKSHRMKRNIQAL